MILNHYPKVSGNKLLKVELNFNDFYVIIHFIVLSVEALGIKDTLPAYLDPNLQSNDLPTGVCFASSGSGCDPLTATIQVYIIFPILYRFFFS